MNTALISEQKLIKTKFFCCVLIGFTLHSHFQLHIFKNVHICSPSNNAHHIELNAGNFKRQNLAATTCDRKKYSILYYAHCKQEITSFVMNLLFGRF